MNGTGRRDDTWGHPAGVKVIPRQVWMGLEAFKHIITEGGGRMIADHEHSLDFSFMARDKTNHDVYIHLSMAIHEAERICIISRAEGMNGSIAAHVQHPWCFMLTFSKPGLLGNANAGKPVIVDFPAAMTANHFAYLCLRTLVNEWAIQMPDISFPMGARTIKMPDGMELRPEQLALPG